VLDVWFDATFESLGICPDDLLLNHHIKKGKPHLHDGTVTGTVTGTYVRVRVASIPEI